MPLYCICLRFPGSKHDATSLRVEYKLSLVSSRLEGVGEVSHSQPVPAGEAGQAPETSGQN